MIKTSPFFFQSCYFARFCSPGLHSMAMQCSCKQRNAFGRTHHATQTFSVLFYLAVFTIYKTELILYVSVKMFPANFGCSYNIGMRLKRVKCCPKVHPLHWLPKAHFAPQVDMTLILLRQWWIFTYYFQKKHLMLLDFWKQLYTLQDRERQENRGIIDICTVLLFSPKATELFCNLSSCVFLFILSAAISPLNLMFLCLLFIAFPSAHPCITHWVIFLHPLLFLNSFNGCTCLYSL